MKDKGLLGEIIHDIYPQKKTEAFYDIALVAIIVLLAVKYIDVGFTESISIWGSRYICLAIVAGIKYAWRRDVFGGDGGCLGML